MNKTFQTPLLVGVFIGAILSSSSVSATEQAAAFEAASKQCKKTAKNSRISMGLHGAAAAVCGYACAASFADWAGVGRYTCMGSTVAAGGADALLTYQAEKNAQALIQPLVGTAMSVGQTFLLSGGPKGLDFGKTAQEGVASRLAEADQSKLTEALKSGDASEISDLTGISQDQAKQVVKNYQETGMPSDLAKDGSLAKDVKPEKDIGACLSAVMETGQALMRGIGAQKDDECAKKNEQRAQALQSPTPQGFNLNSSESPTAASRVNSEIAGGTAAIQAKEDFTLDQCGQHKTSGNTQAFLSCAVTTNKNFPKVLAKPGFAEEFEKLSGQNLLDYLDQLGEGSSGPQALGQAMGATGKSQEIEKEYAAIEKNLLNAMDLDSSSSLYAGGGKRRGSGTPSDPTQLLGALMKNLLPQGKQKEKSAQTLSEYQKNRSLAGKGFLPQQRNLFEQVSRRYLQSRDRIQSLPWRSRFNRMVR